MLDAGVVNVHVYFAFSAQCIFKALVIKIQLQAVQVTLSLCVFYLTVLEFFLECTKKNKKKKNTHTKLLRKLFSCTVDYQM